MKRSTARWFMAVLASALIAGCGGGGGGNNNQGSISGKVTLSGTVATGAAIGGADITIRDAAGVVTPTTTKTDGSYTVELTGTAPWILRVPKPGATEQYLYSYAGSGGTAITANIHPLTDPIIRTWFRVQGHNIDTVFGTYGSSSAVPTPKEAEIAVIKSVIKEVVKDILAATGVSADFDPITSTFAADSTGFDKVLDGVTVNTSGSSMNIAVVPDSALDDAIATSGGNTTVSVDTNSISFAEDTTKPSAPTGLSALAVSSSQVLLTWSASSSADAIGYKVFQGGTEVATVTSTVYIVPSLTDSTSYSFTVKAFDAAKNLSDASSPASATTSAAAADITAPADPSNLSATVGSSSQIDLSWTASTSTDTVGYIVYRGTTAIAKVFTTKYSDTGLAADTYYTYKVKAFDGALNYSGESNTASATTSSTTDTTAPTAPTNLTATVNSENNTSQIDLSWTVSTDSVGVTGYFVYRGTTKVGTTTTTSYSDTGLTASTAYSYTVKAVDAAGNVSSASNTATATTASGSATTNPLIGSWYGGNPGQADNFGIITFLDNSNFIHAQDLDPSTNSDPMSDGIERGTYTWTSSTFTPTVTLDTNGHAGFSDASGTALSYTISGNQLTFSVPGEGSYTITKVVADATNPLIGSWYIGDPGQPDNLGVLTFLDDTNYIEVQDDADVDMPDGLERGTYTWTSSTITPTTVTLDTNGHSGLSDGVGTAIQYTISGNQLTFPGGTILTRVQ